MKRFNRKFIFIMMISMFLFTGCSKFNFDTFNASEDETTSQITETPSDSSVAADNITNSIDEPADDVNVADQSEDEDSAVTTYDKDLSKEEPISTTPTPTAIQPSANIELPIYTVNADTGEIEPVTALVQEGSKITPEMIVDTVVESMADQSIDLKIKNVTTDGDAIIVNFDKDKTPFNNNLGSGYEAATLDAIAQSLIDQLDEFNKVIFRVDDGPYVSGVFEMGLDDPYFER